MTVKDTLHYALGLDIGIASVGWCLLGEDRIIAMGVRAFDAAEMPKSGKGLNTDRREKRLLRRRIRRRAFRLLRARRLFKREGLLLTSALPIQGGESTPWQLRVDALERMLSPEEWAVALFHLIKHRGFHSNRKSELEGDKEVGRMFAGVQENLARLKSGLYRTPAELALNDARFSQHKRNKGGNYSHTFSRQALADELALIFSHQRRLGNRYAGEDFEQAVMRLFWSQRPPLTGDDMQKLLGKCTFEPDQYRAPKRSASAERFVWLSKINNLFIVDDGERRPLTDPEKRAIVDLPFSGRTEKITYKKVRNQLSRALDFPNHLRFAGLAYTEADQAENATLFAATGWHTLRRTYDRAGLSDLWQTRSQDLGWVDDVSHALSVLKTDQELQDRLSGMGLTQGEVDALLRVSFKDFLNLSLRALSKLLPLLRQGLRFDQAATEVYGNHHGRTEGPKSRFLPPVDRGEIRNPVVFRALNQARKVVNAIIRTYGSPARVHIELARDLGRPFDERKRILGHQQRYRDEKASDISDFEQEFGFAPHPRNQDLLKWRLYHEQEGKCPYSLQPLAANGDVATVFDATRTQIDHILPYSRSFDDSHNNKVLVLTAENQNKGNRTPFEYLGGDRDSEAWRAFQAWVKGNPKLRLAKRQRLLREHFGKEAEEFKQRNLNDTRYISRHFKAMVENLVLADGSDAQRCVVVNGQLTAFLRTRWGLLKDRGAGDLHHALDAAVIAACDHRLVKRLSDYARRGELAHVRSGFVDATTGEVIDVERLRQLEQRFPEPFPHFREHVQDRLSPNPVYAKSILVSRAPKRRKGGAAHEGTIRSARRMQTHGVSAVKTPLTKLNLGHLNQLAGRDDPRNHALYALIRERLEAHRGNGQNAFDPRQPPLRKPCKQGEGPIVRSVKLEQTQKGGVPARGGIADNEAMLRVDVFRRSGKHYVVPVYVVDVLRSELPNRAVVAHKAEDQWTLIDDSFEFLFSLYPNDFVRLRFRGKPELCGYYAGMDRSTGAISIWAHDRNITVGSDGQVRGIGLKTALSIEKFHVDVLGGLYPVTDERRRDLAQHRR